MTGTGWLAFGVPRVRASVWRTLRTAVTVRVPGREVREDTAMSTGAQCLPEAAEQLAIECSSHGMLAAGRVRGLAVTADLAATVAHLRQLIHAAAQPVAADGSHPAWREYEPATGAALSPVPGGRHRSRRSRDDAVERPPSPVAARAPAVPSPAASQPAAKARRVTGALGRRAQRNRPGRHADQVVTVLYDTHYRALTQIAALLVNDVAVAEEVVQAAFIAMHGARRRLRDSDEALSYLRQAVVRRARSRRAAHPDLPGRRASPQQVERPAVLPAEAFLVAALRALPGLQREALVLRYYADLPDTQIAFVMGIRTRLVNNHVERGKARLQAALERRHTVVVHQPAAAAVPEGSYSGRGG